MIWVIQIQNWTKIVLYVSSNKLNLKTTQVSKHENWKIKKLNFLIVILFL